jgi:hypothetical protein
VDARLRAAGAGAVEAARDGEPGRLLTDPDGVPLWAVAER